MMRKWKKAMALLLTCAVTAGSFGGVQKVKAEEATGVWKVSQLPVKSDTEMFVTTGKRLELNVSVNNVDKSNLVYRWYCDGERVHSVGEAVEAKKENDGNVYYVDTYPNPQTEKLTIDAESGTHQYTCDIYNNATQEVAKGAGSFLVTGYDEEVDIMYKESADIKDIIGKEVSLKEVQIPASASKALTVDAKKQTLKMNKHCSNVKVSLVTTTGQTMEFKVSTEYQQPVIKAKKGALKTYIEGKYRKFSFKNSNIKGASKVVFEYSKKEDSGYKKSKKKEFLVKKGSTYYIRAYAMYGKQKSPYSEPVKIKG